MTFVAARAAAPDTRLNAPVKAIMKYYHHLSLAAILLLALFMAGCTDPDPNPVEAPPPLRDGIGLDLNATDIAPADKPYIVNEDWIIPPGRTVRIQPGTEIMFSGKYWVDVRGKLEAVGTPENPITFTTAFVEPKLGQWRGFKLRDGSDGESVFKHCIFTWGAYYDIDTLTLDPVEPVVQSNTFRGMLCVRNSSPTIEHCVVTSNQNNAISLSGPLCAPRIRYNIFTENDASAVRADTLVPIADYLGEPNKPDVSYNCVGENSSIPFVYGFDSTRFGLKILSNANRDSVDFFYNLDRDPEMNDPLHGDFSLGSCSPCVDAGPVGVDLDFDNTRADMGATPYVQVPGEMRGLLTFDTLYASTFYRISCDCFVDSGRTLYVEPGTRIEATGLFTFTIRGQLIVNGSANARVTFNAETGTDLWGGLLLTNFDTLAPASILNYADISNFRRFNVDKSRTRFDHCTFTNGFLYGLDIATASPAIEDTVSIQNCTFTECGEFAVKADSSACTVRNSIVQGMRGRGIWMSDIGSAGAVTNCIIRDNETIGLILENFSNPNVINNTILGNGYFGFQLIDNCNPLTLNNIIVQNQRYGVYTLYSSVPIMEYNDVWGHAFNSLNTDYVPASIAHSNSLSDDPQFAGIGDAHLAAGSPCINAGDPRPEYNDPDGSRNDMGAYGGPGAQLGVGLQQSREIAARLILK